MMMSESPFESRRRTDVLSRVRKRLASRAKPSTDAILEAEQKLFAEDDQYIPQLLREYAVLLGESPVNTTLPPLAETLPDFPASVEPISIIRTLPQRDDVLKPPKIVEKELTEFDKHHNAVRLYIIQQFTEGKKSREIAGMIGITPHKLTRWYNQVKELPQEMQLWTPLFKQEEVGQWDSQEEVPEPEPAVPVVKVASSAPRLVEPSPEAVKAAKRSLRQAAKRTQIARDRAAISAWIKKNTPAQEDSLVASRMAALAFHQEGWSLSQIARALDLDVSTISRWMTRMREIQQAEQQAQNAEQQAQKLKAKPVIARPPRPKVTLPRPRAVKVALPRPVVPLSAMAKRSVGMLQLVFEQAEVDNGGTLRLSVASAMERERIMAALSMIDVQPARPLVTGNGFVIPLPPEEALYLKRMLAQA